MAAQSSDPLVQNPTLSDVVHPDFHQVNSTVEIYIKNQLGLKLDTGKFLLHKIYSPDLLLYRRANLPTRIDTRRLSARTSSLSFEAYDA